MSENMDLRVALDRLDGHERSLASLSSAQSGSGLPSNIVYVTSAHTASDGDFVVCDATDGAFTVTLPSAGVVIVYKDDGSANAVGVDAAGSGVINNDTDDPAIELTADQAGVLLQSIAAGTWKIVASVPSAGGGGGSGSGLPDATGATAGQTIILTEDGNADSAEWTDTATLSNDDPLPAGVTAAGSSDEAARADHVHPSEGSGVKLPLNLHSTLTGSENDSLAATKNREYLVGFLLAPQTFDRISVNIKIAGESGTAKARLGIREDDDGTPGTALIDTVVNGDSTGWITATINHTHPGGVLWVTVTGQGWTTTNITFCGISPGGMYGVPPIIFSGLSSPGWATGHKVIAYQDGVSGALSSTFVNVAATTTNFPEVALRRSA